MDNNKPNLMSNFNFSEESFFLPPFFNQEFRRLDYYDDAQRSHYPFDSYLPFPTDTLSLAGHSEVYPYFPSSLPADPRRIGKESITESKEITHPQGRSLQPTMGYSQYLGAIPVQYYSTGVHQLNAPFSDALYNSPQQDQTPYVPNIIAQEFAYNNCPPMIRMPGDPNQYFGMAEAIPSCDKVPALSMVRPTLYGAPKAGLRQSITLEERKRKIERYMEKKKKRIWEKRIHYTCRKNVADKRLRIRGRFVPKKEEREDLERSVPRRRSYGKKQGINSSDNAVVSKPRKIFKVTAFIPRI